MEVMFNMESLFLAKPNKEYQQSFENYVLSYKNINDTFYFNIYKKALDNFDEYITDLFNYSKGINLPKGWVATSTFWLIDKNEVVGVLRIRHKEIPYAGHIGYDIAPNFRNKGYGTEIVKLALEKAKNLGITEALVNCNIANIASRRVIEKNNGKLLGIIFAEEQNEELYKYSITTY
jgi:predicted acetyltransferase